MPGSTRKAQRRLRTAEEAPERTALEGQDGTQCDELHEPRLQPRARAGAVEDEAVPAGLERRNLPREGGAVARPESTVASEEPSQPGPHPRACLLAPRDFMGVLPR